MMTAMTPQADVAARVATVDWERISRNLDDQGNAVIERLLSDSECRLVAGWYAHDELFRSRRAE